MIDDDARMLLALGELLDTDPRIDVIATYNDSRRGLAAIDELAPDAVLLDLHMPHLGGLELLRTLRTRHPRLRLVLMSATADDDVDATDAGADAFVSKWPASVIVAALLDGRA